MQSTSENHEVDEMFAKLTLFQNVSLLWRTKLLSPATDSLRQYRHVEITCWPTGSYICSPGTAREVVGLYTVAKTRIKLWDNTYILITVFIVFIQGPKILAPAAGHFTVY